MPGRFSRSAIRRLVVLLSVLLLTLGLSACQTPDIGPTPTATRTPIIPTDTPTLTPTATPTATPTVTPTPTPTLPAGLILPATPIAAETYAPLPTDLYFLRDGALWLWGAEGGTLQEIALDTGDAGEIILDYRITPNRSHIAYVTNLGKLYTFDSALWQSAYIPTSGDILHDGKAWFEISDDGSTITYMAWHTHPDTEQPPVDPTTPYGTVLSVNRRNPRELQEHLGFCTTIGGTPCAGFILSPNQTQVLISDGRGLWLTSREKEKIETVFLIPALPNSTQLLPISWSIDMRYVLFEQYAHQDDDLSNYTYFDLSTTNTLITHSLECGSDNCILDAAWDATDLWLSSDSASQGCIASWALTNSDQLPDSIACKINGWLMHPTSMKTLPDGQVRFLNHGCGKGCDGPGPGVYQYTTPDSFIPIALLPESGGSLIWNANGSAFLYLDIQGEPAYLGSIPGAQHWDVKTLLQGAYAFSWVHPVVP